MKKLWFFMIALLLSFGMFGCKEGDNGGNGGGGDTYRLINWSWGEYDPDERPPEMTLTLKGDTVFMETKEFREYSEELLNRLGISGTVTATQAMRAEMKKVSLEDGILTARVELAEMKYYRTTTYEGTGAEAFKEVMRERIEEALANAEMTREEYEAQLAMLEGKEIEVPTGEEGDYAFGETHGIVKLRLKEDGTCYLLESLSYAGDEIVTEMIFTYDGDVLVSEENKSKYENRNDLTVYYPNGQVKLYRYPDQEYWHSVGPNGEEESFVENVICEEEYYENGLAKRETKTYEDGRTEGYYYEYDDNQWLKKETEVRSYGTIVTEYTYDENGLVKTETETNGDGEVTVTSYEYHDNGEIKTQTTQYHDGSKNVDEYYENGYCKKSMYYDETGTLRSTSEFNEEQDLVRETYYYEEGGWRLTEYNEDGTVTYCYYDETGNRTGKEVVEYNEDREPVRETQYNENDEIAYQTEYHYFSSTGNLQLEVCYDAECIKLSEVEYYENGETKRVTEYDETGNVTYEIKYDENGNVIES